MADQMSLRNTREELVARVEELGLEAENSDTKKILLSAINNVEESLYPEELSGESADHHIGVSDTIKGADARGGENVSEDEPKASPVHIPESMASISEDAYPMLTTFCEEVRSRVDKRSGLSLSLMQMLDMSLRVMSQCKAVNDQAFNAVCKSPRSFHHRRFHTVCRRVVGTTLKDADSRAERFHLLAVVKEMLSEMPNEWCAAMFNEVGEIGSDFQLTRTP